MLFGIYVVTMVLPYYFTAIQNVFDAKNFWFVLHLGIFHIPSIAYIFGAALLLHWSVGLGKDKVLHSKKELQKEMEEAETLLRLDEFDSERFLNSENGFIKDIKTAVLNGGIEEDMEIVVEKRVLDLSTKYERLIAEYGYIAAILPMLGMLGTITGLLQMFAVADGVDNIAQKMASLSVALATTLYATLWVVLITKPKSREIEAQLIELGKKEHALVLSARLFLHNVDMNLLAQYAAVPEDAKG